MSQLAGHVVFAQEGKYILQVILSGIWTDEPGVLDPLLDPVVEEMVRWDPEEPVEY